MSGELVRVVDQPRHIQENVSRLFNCYCNDPTRGQLTFDGWVKQRELLRQAPPPKHLKMANAVHYALVFNND